MRSLKEIKALDRAIQEKRREEAERKGRCEFCGASEGVEETRMLLNLEDELYGINPIKSFYVCSRHRAFNGLFIAPEKAEKILAVARDTGAVRGEIREGGHEGA